ncbi:TPA: hypothetical protein NI671_002594 [Pseudomonas aeruginosa]|uniref:hypothetical protein n=1 Tax=Pseudomonas aeruginosa TaxID=287 RepID=UPI001DC4A5DB|nr:hypothetical protein [Pseudomonas aeruginosa]MBX6698963.1 hypothetical protein [Pseudomonas aeruginosa]WMX07977.1 hypothetical protein RG643_30045 [Pseudomonas aeruginosa]HCF4366163.1 hypothetical protein [Pseudomonas aeruginosa]HCF4370132.1 hypothetical protein [Pseudomonas aeruginosa]HCF4411219.1 hypothetical protein [Pseudomonas aeruginosa]
MVDLLPVLMDATRTLERQMEQWFSAYPRDMPWTVVSDYCIGDRNKKNDVFSFVVIANHDTAANICDYIAHAVPRDIKATRQIPLGLVQYLRLPVAFSLSFVLDRDSALLRDYARLENMVEFIPSIREFVESLGRNSPPGLAYFDEVQTRLNAFQRDLARPQVNAKLARQIHLAAAFAATVFAWLAASLGLVTYAGYRIATRSLSVMMALSLISRTSISSCANPVLPTSCRTNRVVWCWTSRGSNSNCPRSRESTDSMSWSV